MKNNNRRFLVLSLLLVAIVSMISVSFAYFTIQVTKGESFTLSGKASSKDPRIDFAGSQDISLSNTYPMTNEYGLKTRPYTFNITNREDRAIKVEIIMEVTPDSDLEEHLVNVALDGNIKNARYLYTVTPSSSVYKKSYVVGSYIIEAKGTVSGEFKMWINSYATVDNAQNKTWKSKILAMPSFIE